MAKLIPTDISADNTLKIGDVTYFVYNLSKLMRYQFYKTIAPKIFAYCGFCRVYRWKFWMSNPDTHGDIISVCETCHNHVTGIQITLYHE